MNHCEELAPLLQSLKITFPLIQQLFPLDVMFGLTDLNQFIYYLPGRKLDLKLHEGTVVPSGGGIRKVLETGQMVSASVPKEAYGLPFKSVSIPLKHTNGTMFGVLTMGISLENQEILTEAAQSLAATSEQITATSEEIASSATELANTVGNLKNIGQQVVGELQKTDEILSFIENVAKNSNLLGINALIEAARAGEHGRGFEVVANEIMKMADTSTSSAKQIEKILSSIKGKVDLMDQALFDCLGQSERQEAATEEISASMQQLAASSIEIEKISSVM